MQMPCGCPWPPSRYTPFLQHRRRLTRNPSKMVTQMTTRQHKWRPHRGVYHRRGMANHTLCLSQKRNDKPQRVVFYRREMTRHRAILHALRGICYIVVHSATLKMFIDQSTLKGDMPLPLLLSNFRLDRSRQVPRQVGRQVGRQLAKWLGKQVDMQISRQRDEQVDR